MRRISYILSILTLLLAFSHNASATNQVRDIIIINKVEHRLNKVLLYQLDSVIYDALGKKLEFDKGTHRLQWSAGSVSALRAIKDKCYREISIELYGNDHDIIGNSEIVRYLIKTEK